MKHGYRLYSTRDHTYYGGVFETRLEVDAYAVYMGILPDEYVIHTGQATWFDVVPFSDKWHRVNKV